MEYHNDNRTPLERINDSFLAEILENDGAGRSSFSPFASNIKGSCSNAHDQRCDKALEEHHCSCNESVTADNTDCSYFKSPTLSTYPLSMVYSPCQEFDNIYDCELALTRGTIFKALDFPFCGSTCYCSKQNKNCR